MIGIKNKWGDTRPGTKAVWLIAVALAVLLWLNQILALAPAKGKAQALEGSGLPPTLAVTTIALGPLRGFIANGLWWRIIEQQDAGNYFEIIQLAEWITVLQPHNPKVWTYQAWNMAFNICAEFPDPESRWKWIYKALCLLVDEGLDKNPGNQTIKNEIANIFASKIGSHTELGQQLFKRNWAALMARYMPDGSQANLKALADAPSTQAELLRFPAVAALVDGERELGLNLLHPNVPPTERWTAKQRRLLEASTESKVAFARVSMFFLAAELRSKFKLDPKRMLYIDQQYGPFDWRLPQAYVAYWAATCGFQEYIEDKVNSQPLVRQAMQASFMEGRLIYDPANGIFITTHNFRIIGKLHDYYDYLMDHHYSGLVSGMHKGFLENAAAVLYSSNETEAAKKVFEHYQADYAKGMDFDTFIASTLYKSLHNQSFNNRRALIESSLVQAFNWMASGDVQRAIGYANFAQLIWRRNQQEFADKPGLLLPPFADLKRAAYEKVINSDIAPVFKRRLATQSVSDTLPGEDAAPVYLGNTNPRNDTDTQSGGQ